MERLALVAEFRARLWEACEKREWISRYEASEAIGWSLKKFDDVLEENLDSIRCHISDRRKLINRPDFFRFLTATSIGGEGRNDMSGISPESFATMFKKPSEREMKWLTILGDKGPLTVRELLDHDSGQKPSYASAVSLIKKMAENGLVESVKSKEAEKWRAIVHPDQGVGSLMRNILTSLLTRRPSMAFQQLMSAQFVDKHELKLIKECIAQYEEMIAEGAKE